MIATDYTGISTIFCENGKKKKTVADYHFSMDATEGNDQIQRM